AEGPFNAYRYEDPARTRADERRPLQRFDRVAFALGALRLLPLAKTRVAVFRSGRLELKQGLDMGRGPDARWVMLGIPGDASAESIALALTELVGPGGLPYGLAAMLALAERAGHAN